MTIPCKDGKINPNNPPMCYDGGVGQLGYCVCKITDTFLVSGCNYTGSTTDTCEQYQQVGTRCEGTYTPPGGTEEVYCAYYALDCNSPRPVGGGPE